MKPLINGLVLSRPSNLNQVSKKAGEPLKKGSSSSISNSNSLAMGSCVSKCCQASPEIDGDSSVVQVQEKLVVSESTIATQLHRVDLPETHTSPSVYYSSSSSSPSPPLSSSSSSSSSFSSCTITSISTGSTSVSASSVCPQLSSAKHKPRKIIVLDPHRQVIAASPAPRTRPLPAKRARSSSNSMTARHESPKERLRENGAYEPSKCMEKAKLRRVHQIIHSATRQPLVEDMNNPLISMDCFIFL